MISRLFSREEKEQSSNLVATLVRMETADGEDFTHFSQELAVLLPRGEQEDLRRAFTAWMVRVLRETHPGATIPLVEDLEEIPMLVERIRARHRKEYREALLEGTRKTLLRQIERRFGPVPASVRARIESLSSKKALDEITDGILTAESLRELGLE